MDGLVAPTTLLSACAHGIDANFETVNVMLDLVRIKQDETRENITAVIQDVMKDWKISKDQLVGVMTDGAANMNYRLDGRVLVLLCAARPERRRSQSALTQQLQAYHQEANLSRPTACCNKSRRSLVNSPRN